MGRAVTKQERRDFSRIALRRPATLDVLGAKTTCEVVDLSLRGALLRVPVAFGAAVGQVCVLTVQLDRAFSIIRMVGTIAHGREGTVGVRCREIDLDSIVHLRRLVEVNLGDDRLLRREWSALVSGRASG
jgi:hypothetical protein